MSGVHYIIRNIKAQTVKATCFLVIVFNLTWVRHSLLLYPAGTGMIYSKTIWKSDLSCSFKTLTRREAAQRSAVV